MTRRDYEAVARLLAEHVRDPVALGSLACAFVDLFKADNPQFDALKWHRAILRRHLELSLEQT